MRKITLLIAFIAMVSTSVHAQLKETFDSNKLGWTEISSKDGEAIITEGKMHMEGKSDSFIETHCYAPIDFTKDFEITCEALVKKINDNNNFGLIMDYKDDGNMMVFIITEGHACLRRFYNNQLVGEIHARIKLKEQKKANVELKIKSTYQRLEFFVNDMKALECRYLPLTSSGFGFYLAGKQKIDFDNVVFKQ